MTSIGEVRTVEEMASHTLLRVNSVTEDWPSFFEQVSATLVCPARELYFDAIHLALDAAIQGLGIALGRRPLIDQDLAAGRLVEVMDPAVQPAIESITQHWLVCSPESSRWPEISRFREWITHRLGLSETPVPA